MIISFTKACALGNDFVIVPIPEGDHDLGALSIFLSDRRLGVGCDQVIYVDKTTSQAEFKIRFFNADGSEAEACGNGTRCVAKHLMDQGVGDTVTLVTKGGPLKCTREERGIRVEMPFSEVSAVFLGNYDHLSDPGAVFVTVGNPHLVCFVKDVEQVKTWGPLLEKHLHKLNNHFPERVNVGFAKILDSGHLLLKVWERGAGLTPACGTGACASVVAAGFRGLTEGQVTVQQEGGSLDIHFQNPGLFMTGSADIVYTGQLSLKVEGV